MSDTTIHRVRSVGTTARVDGSRATIVTPKGPTILKATRGLPGPQGPAGTPAGALSLVAGAPVTIGSVVALNADGDVVLADATFANDRWRPIGLSLGNAAATDPVDVQTNQGAQLSAVFASPPAASENRRFVFLSDTPGQVTLVPPSVSGQVRFQIGLLQGADGITSTPEILLSPQYISRIP